MGYPARRPSPYGRSGWDPLGELSALRAELNRVVGSVLGGLYGERGWFGDVDLEQSEEGWTVTARLPGVAPEEVLVELDDRELCIRASAAEDEEDEDEQGGRQTRRGFNYRLVVPGDVDPDRVDATMDHGLLTVHLRRSTRSRRRSVSVSRGPGTAGGGATAGGATAGGAAAGVATAGAASPDATAGEGAVVAEQTAVPPIAAQQGEPDWVETNLVETSGQPGAGDTGSAGTGPGEQEAGWPEPPRPASP